MCITYVLSIYPKLDDTAYIYIYIYIHSILIQISILVTSSEDPCGANKPVLLSGSTAGNITSSGFPDGYANDQDCQWRIQVDEGSTVKITFLSFNVEDG